MYFRGYPPLVKELESAKKNEPATTTTTTGIAGRGSAVGQELATVGRPAAAAGRQLREFVVSGSPPGHAHPPSLQIVQPTTTVEIAGPAAAAAGIFDGRRLRLLDAVERHGLVQQLLILRMATLDGQLQSVAVEVATTATTPTTGVADQQHVVQAVESALLVQREPPERQRPAAKSLDVIRPALRPAPPPPPASGRRRNGVGQGAIHSASAAAGL